MNASTSARAKAGCALAKFAQVEQIPGIIAVAVGTKAGPRERGRLNVGETGVRQFPRLEPRGIGPQKAVGCFGTIPIPALQ